MKSFRNGIERNLTEGEIISLNQAILEAKTLKPLAKSLDEQINSGIQNDPVFRAFAMVCAEQFGMTIQELKLAIKAKMQ